MISTLMPWAEKNRLIHRSVFQTSPAKLWWSGLTHNKVTRHKWLISDWNCERQRRPLDSTWARLSQASPLIAPLTDQFTGTYETALKWRLAGLFMLSMRLIWTWLAGCFQIFSWTWVIYIISRKNCGKHAYNETLLSRAGIKLRPQTWVIGPTANDRADQ